MLISGLAEEQCQHFFGTDAWNELDARWCPPDQLAAIAAEQPVLWLYRAPWVIPVDEPEAGAVETDEAYLTEWAKHNRTVLTLRARLGKRLLLANIDRIPAPMLQARLLDKRLPDKCELPTSPPGLLAQAMAWCLPQVWDIYEALEASSWIPVGEPQFRGSITMDEAELHVLLHKLRRLPQLQQELAALKEHITDIDTWQAEKDSLAQENELLLIQLHQVQEELEQYYLKNLELGKKTDEAGILRGKLQKEQTSTKALRTQLRQMQTELQRLKILTPQPLPVSKALVPVDGHPKKIRIFHKWGALVPRPAKSMLRRSRDRKSLQEQARLVRASGWFDAQWYLQKYPDVRQANVDPAEHYLSTGWHENRNPGKSFDTAYYLRTNPDIRDSGLNPLWHFIHYGRNEGRLPRKP